jgi:phosphohistidine swiveling domain-containing protein/membrane protein insertase Oxa1/YidC/SpoIIIJ
MRRWQGLALLAVALWPAQALALPTPDAVIGSVQVLPILLGAVGAAAAWAARAIWRMLGGHKDARRPLATMAIVFGVGFAVTAGALAFQWSRLHALEDSLNLGQMLRCDPGFHAHRAQRTIDLAKGVLLPRVTIDVLAKELDQRFATDPGYDPVLVSVLNTRTSYDSGFLGVGPADHRRYFEYVPPKQITAYLEKIPAAQRATRDLVVEIINVREEDIEGFLEIAHAFKSVRLIERIDAIRGGKEVAYGRAGPHQEPTMFVREDNGTIRPAVFLPTAQRAYWTVPVPKLHYDEAHIHFPNMERLLPVHAALDHVYKTPIVYIFSAGYPLDRDVAAEFAYALFTIRMSGPDRKIDTRDPRNGPRLIAALRKVDVYLFDVLDASEANLRQIVDAIGDRPFLTVPISSVHVVFGADVPRAVEHAMRVQGKPFRYLGTTLQMPEAVTMTEQDLKSVSAVGPVRAPITGVIVRALDVLDGVVHSPGAALVLFGLVLRLLFLPLIVNTRRVKRLQRAITESKLDYLTRMAAAKRALRMGPRYEMPGALANILFLVPFFAAPSAWLTGKSFAGIADLGAPNPVVAVVLGLLFGVVATLMVTPGSRSKIIVTALVSIVGLAVLATFAVPAGIGLYACGGLVVTITAEILAGRGARAALHRLVLGAPAPSTNPTGACLTLTDAAGLAEVGGKASALGTLASASGSTELFTVPPGVVFRDFGKLQLADDAAFARAVRDQLAAKLPGAARMTFAVRSSAPGEDGDHKSQAGRYISVLNVPFDGVAEALRTVLTSYGEEAVHRDYRVGVLVQVMAPADLAGVMFTRSPSNGMLVHINYTEGLGDRLVSGEVQATEMFIARRSGAVRPANGNTKLGERLFLAGLAVEQLFGKPQDIEWAYHEASDTLSLLQSRPITAVEYAPAVLEEQEQHIASLAALAKGEDGTRVRWKRSDVREVVENPSGLAASIIRETYAPGGALTIASRSLGLHVGDMKVLSLFGQFYERTGASLVSALRFRLGSRRLQRGIEHAGWPAKLRAACERPLPPTQLDAVEPRKLAGQIVGHLRTFIREVYPVAVEATVLAKIAQPEELPRVHTIAVDMFEDLARAAETGQVDDFIARWGHRSESDYDPAIPDFGEDREALTRYAAGFHGVHISQDARPDAPSVYAELVQLKELTKDRAVRYLRQVRPALIRLASLLDLAPEGIFVLELGSLDGLADGRRSVLDLVAEVHAGVQRQAAWKSVSLPDEVSLAGLEFLGAFGDADTAASAEAKFVATKKAFSGRVVHLSGLAPDEDVAGAILVTEMLQPSLVKYYGRIAGIISERGAYLSHAAIVGREAGVPIVVLPRALTTLAHGSVVSVTEGGVISQAAPHSPAPVHATAGALLSPRTA